MARRLTGAAPSQDIGTGLSAGGGDVIVSRTALVYQYHGTVNPSGKGKVEATCSGGDGPVPGGFFNSLWTVMCEWHICPTHPCTGCLCDTTSLDLASFRPHPSKGEHSVRGATELLLKQRGGVASNTPVGPLGSAGRRAQGTIHGGNCSIVVRVEGLLPRAVFEIAGLVVGNAVVNHAASYNQQGLWFLGGGE